MRPRAASSVRRLERVDRIDFSRFDLGHLYRRIAHLHGRAGPPNDDYHVADLRGGRGEAGRPFGRRRSPASAGNVDARLSLQLSRVRAAGETQWHARLRVIRESVKLTTMKLILAIVLVGSVVSVEAAPAAGPTAFVCRFGGGTISIDKVRGGKFVTKPSSDQKEITFAAVDWAKRSAQMIANQGTASVTVLRGEIGTHFLEMTPAGIFITVTTIFDIRGEVVAGQGVNAAALDAASELALAQTRQPEVARLLAGPDPGGSLLAVHSPNAPGGPLSPMASPSVGLCKPRYP